MHAGTQMSFRYAVKLCGVPMRLVLNGACQPLRELVIAVGRLDVRLRKAPRAYSCYARWDRG